MGLSELAGTEMKNFVTEQGTSQIDEFVKQWRITDMAGVLFRIALAWTQLLAGTTP